MDSGRQVGHRTEICTKVYALRKYTFIITCEDERAHTTCILLTEFELSQRKSCAVQTCLETRLEICVY